ncbi:hypothetical protein Pan216_38470 [Planctomycetes bacterium Pan216]|uniref:Uncharacterized protein n=1 Tax=Kolteria novifilia TaxID=2527975 RepID=A0A518B7P3_9BACT|nr:hypothetical protein Pan216_38470 [Planctomycetes bacterium Pan216]
MLENDERLTEPEARRPPIEIGWVVVGKLDKEDQEALTRVREEVLAYLQRVLPGFAWSMPVVYHEDFAVEARQEPIELLDHGLAERDQQRWDFVFVVASTALVTRYKPQAFGALSRAYGVAILSTMSIDPKARRKTVERSVRVDRMAARLQTLFFHSLGHFGGLDNREQGRNVMLDYSSVLDLDRAERYSEQQLECLRTRFQTVADRRLEESLQGRQRQTAVFYAHAALLNHREIRSAIWEAKPWEFPFRYSRQTAAAFSTLMILLLTAEVWDLGMGQHPVALGVITTSIVLGTTFYTFLRRRLYVPNPHGRRREQIVVTNVAAFAIVLTGMLTTFLLLAGLSLLLEMTFFQGTIVHDWTESPEGTITLRHYFRLSAFIASVGLVIGVLGGNFEGEHHYRHITFVDEEI